VIVGHHGYGEEVVLYALTGGGVGSALVVVWRVRLSRAVRWLRRR
jgi:hypothetical protein